MPLSNTAKHHFVEVTRHTLHAVRTAGTTIDFCRECALEDRTTVQEILRAWGEGVTVEPIAAVAPQPIHWHLSDAEQARRLRTDAHLRRFATHLSHGFRAPLEIIGCNAADGLPISAEESSRWLLAVTPGSALAAAAADPIERGVVIAALGSATLGRIAAVTAAVRLAGGGAVRLWDPGPQQSHVFTITAQGVEAVTPCAAGFDGLFGLIQHAFKLKDRGAAARLFYSDHAAIRAEASRLAGELAPALDGALRTTRAAGGPVSFACTGLTGRQAWFGDALASKLGLPAWEPPIPQYLKYLQMSVAPGCEPALSADLLGVLHRAAAHAHGSAAWHPAWGAVSRAAVTTGDQSQAAGGLEWPSKAPAVTAPVAIALSEVSPGVPSRAGEPAAGLPARTAMRAAPAMAPAAKFQPGRTAGNAGAVPRPVPAVARPGAGVPTPVATRPAGAGGSGGSAPSAGAPPVAPREPLVVIVRKGGYGAYFGLVLALAGAALAGKFYFDARALRAAASEEINVAADQQTVVTRERAAAEEQLRQAEEQLRLAEERTHEVARSAAAEAAQIREKAAAEREAAVAAARREAAEETRRQMAAELAATQRANSRGTLRLATSPEGAEVSIDGGPPQRTPVSIADIPPGRRHVRISLAGHVPLELTAGIEGGKTADLGVIPLERATGTLLLASEPAGAEYSIQAVDTGGAAVSLPGGRTPARLEDLPAGDYLVTFRRRGWPEQQERISVSGGATARADTTFTGATVTITSVPPGATVRQRDVVIGTTPLTFTGVPPQELTYELSAENHEPLTLSGTAVPGGELRLGGELLHEDRLASPAELRAPPRPVDTPAPQLGRLARGAPSEVTVTFVVSRDGTLREVAVLGAVDREIARRCVEAVGQWRFLPAVNHDGSPVNVRVSVPLQLSRG